MATLEIKAEQYAYAFSPCLDPIAVVRPGQSVIIHTEDALGGRIRSETDLPSAVLAAEHPNPLTGPLFVEGAEPGDTLAVAIQSIEPTRDFAVSCFVPNMGGLTSTGCTRTLQAPIPERTWIWSLRIGSEGRYLENEQIGVRVPWRPFVGSIGVAPTLEAIASVTPGPHGGNMDCPDVCSGNTLLLPVSVDGALFSAGDCHANQGQGEVCGVALEIPCKISVIFGVQKGGRIAWPRIVSEGSIMTVGSAKPMEDAARIAYGELVLWLEQEHGFTRWEAYQLLGQVGSLYVANMVNPLYSMVASVEKKYLRRSQSGRFDFAGGGR
jgi:amidase